MKLLPYEDALAIVRIASKAGLDVSNLGAVSPWEPSLNENRVVQHLRELVVAENPELAERLMGVAQVEKVPSLQLAAALHRQRLAASYGAEPEPLEPALQAEYDSLHPHEAAQRRAAAEAALLQRWEQGAEQMAQTSRATVADDPQFQARLAASKRQAQIALARASAGL
ncbi:MAG: hypothetical protein VKK62_11680 [Synechococcaceae cyanobacterium]|nr:hypothetical protein [Synechococcaceae cyanobacterium]